MRLSPFAPIDDLLAPPPAPEKVRWIAGNTFAHRGLHGPGIHGPGIHGPGIIENSATAFADAISRGLGIECDVQRSRDGEAMVIHDWELDRLTERTGRIEDLTAAELGGIALAGGRDRILTLREVLEQVAGAVPLLIEVKSQRAKPVAALCHAVGRALAGYRGRHAVMSFDPRVSRWFRRHSPETVRGLVVTEERARGCGGAIRRRLSLWHARPDFLACDIRDLPSPFAASQRRRGLPVAAWTVRSAEDLGRAALHADAPIAEGAGLA